MKEASLRFMTLFRRCHTYLMGRRDEVLEATNENPGQAFGRET